MFYLVLKRDLEKISLARKHVLSDRELSDARRTVWSIVSVALDRIESLRSGFKTWFSGHTVGSFFQALFCSKISKLKISSRSLQRVWCVPPFSLPKNTNFM